MKKFFLLDNNNQLNIKTDKGFEVLDGKISLDNKARLIYWINKPENWFKQYGLSKRIAFVGKWRLNSNHDLELEIEESKDYYSTKLQIKGEIVSFEADTFVFGIVSVSKKRQSHFEILKFSGKWSSDSNNRFVFEIVKDQDSGFVFLGKWKVNDNQQIVYSFSKVVLKRKIKLLRSITIEGFRQINKQNKLTFCFLENSNSELSFIAKIESPNLYPKKGEIKYRLGLEYKRKNFGPKVITLFGEWKFSRKLGIIFEMPYQGKRVSAIRFKVKYNLTPNGEVSLDLLNKENEPLGIKLMLTKKMSKQVSLNFSVSKEHKGVRLEAGGKVLF